MHAAAGERLLDFILRAPGRPDEKDASWPFLFYLASYLRAGGIGIVAAPQFSAKMQPSNAQYPSVLLMASGMFMIALAILVTQIIRHSMLILYSTILIVGIFISLCLEFFVVARSRAERDEHLRAATRSTHA